MFCSVQHCGLIFMKAKRVIIFSYPLSMIIGHLNNRHAVSSWAMAGRIQWLTLGKGTGVGRRLTAYSLALHIITCHFHSRSAVLSPFEKKKKKVNAGPVAPWERTLWSGRVLPAAGRRGKQAQGAGLVLGWPHNGGHGNLLPGGSRRRWVWVVCSFPVGSWRETSPAPLG